MVTAITALFTGVNAAALEAIAQRVDRVGFDPSDDLALQSLIDPDEPDGYYRALADREWLSTFVRQIERIIEPEATEGG